MNWAGNCVPVGQAPCETGSGLCAYARLYPLPPTAQWPAHYRATWARIIRYERLPDAWKVPELPPASAEGALRPLRRHCPCARR